jgi:cobalamin biosynthesis Co2+ chelatase CbiK
MKINKLKKRLDPKRSMSTITMRIPDDLIADLKRVAPHKGFSGYQPLIRAYIGQGLREDLSTLDSKPEITKLIKSLKKQGVTESALTKAMIEAGVMVQNQ